MSNAATNRAPRIGREPLVNFYIYCDDIPVSLARQLIERLRDNGFDDAADDIINSMEVTR